MLDSSELVPRDPLKGLLICRMSLKHTVGEAAALEMCQKVYHADSTHETRQPEEKYN